MPPFIANIRPRSLPRTKHHIPTKFDENYIPGGDENNNSCAGLATNAHQRPRSQIHDQSSFLANLRPRSNTHAGHDNRNVNVHRNLFPNYPRSHDKTNYNINIDQEHTFTANFRPRSHSSSNGQDKNMQDTSFSRLWPRKNKNATNNSNSNCHTTSSHSHSQTNSQESTASSNFRPRSQETSGGNININMNSNSQESSSSNLNLRHRSQASSQDKSSSRLSLRRSQANSQERSTSRLSLRPRSQVNSQQSQESADRPRSPTNIPFLSNFRARPRSSVLEDQLPKSYSHPENPLKPREATEMPVGCGVGAALPRRRSRRTMRRSGKPHTKTNDGHEKGNENSTDPRAHRRAMRRSGKINANEVKENGNETSAGSRAHRRSMRRSGKINISTDDNDNCGENDNDGQDDENITRNASTDSSHIHRAHLARLQTNASTVLKRAIKRVYVEKTILSSLKELDTLIHYAERDLRTIPVVSRRILAIKSANNNNIVVEKQLQAASYLYSLRKKPENEAVKTARIVMNAASGMLDNNDGTSEQVEKFSKMERSLCETANNLGEISNKSCSVREQVLELLVLMTRRRAEIEIKAAICTSTSNIQQHHRGGKCHLESDESFTSEEEESYKSTEEEDLDEKENGSPKNVMKMTITIDADKKRGFTACEPAESLERGNEIGDDNKKKEAAAALIARVWKMKKLGGSKALAYLTRLRDIERDMANCASLTIYDKLTSEARGLAQAIRHDVEIIDPALRSVATTNTINSEEWDRTVTIGRRNAAISTVIRGVRQWRTTRSSEECTKERLRTIETMVESATLSNTEVAYKNTLDKLQHMMSELETTINTNTNIEGVVRRKVISGRNVMLQKQRQLRRSSKRINELRAIEKMAELERISKAAVENKAEDYMNWWTEDGKLKGQLRVLLATLHRILPAWTTSNSNTNTNSNSNSNTTTDGGNDNDNDIGGIGSSIATKRLYRKALLLVHPDRLAKARKLDAFDQVLAQKIFVELQHAYDVFVEDELQPTTYTATNSG